MYRLFMTMESKLEEERINLQQNSLILFLLHAI